MVEAFRAHNPIEHLWDKLEPRLRARPSCPTSVSDLKNVPLEEWSNFPIDTLLNLVDSLPRRVEAVIRWTNSILNPTN